MYVLGGGCCVESSPSVPFTSEAVQYAWRQLAQRAGIRNGDPDGTGFEGLGVSVHYAKPDTVEMVEPSVVVVPCRPGAWEELLDRKPNSLDWLPASHTVPPGGSLPVDDSVPVLFWDNGFEGGQKPHAHWRESP
jgi:hypothetical protein